MRAMLLLTLILVLVASLLAGCAQTQQQKDTSNPQPSETFEGSQPDGMSSATPEETVNTTGDGAEQQEEDSVDSVDDGNDLESNISEVENLIEDLEETEEINFSI
ncbi:MAG: hypothetical protein R6U44_03260 [Archaeoglobaceae archaeon]